MSNSDDDFTLGDLAIFVGAVALGAALLSAIFDKDKKIYRCPNCHLTVNYGKYSCPRCGAKLKW
jgi:rRNA maturation endonuclease Nob1